MQALAIIFSLVLTLFIETGIYMILKHRDLKLFLVTSAMNIVLNVTMNVILTYAIKDETTYWIVLSTFEVMTTLVESLIVYLFIRFKYLKILLFAFIANATSFLIGLALQGVYQNKDFLIALSIIFFMGYLAIYLVVLISFIKKQYQDLNK